MDEWTWVRQFDGFHFAKERLDATSFANERLMILSEGAWTTLVDTSALFIAYAPGADWIFYVHDSLIVEAPR